ncbi:MAG: cation transporter [Notoacmeibacter sp.]|nr:cation transporter [Notoacmeibacter sp.]
MKRVFAGLTVAAVVFVSDPTYATEQTVVLSVPGMYCASCPYIVKQAIAAVDGVTAVSAAFTDKTATVTYDDTVTTIDAIRKATADIGYPSTPVSGEDS